MAVFLKRNFSTHLPTKTKTELEYVDSDSLVDYPLDWINANPGTKPTVVIPKCDLTDDQVYQSARGGIKTISLSLATAKLTLYHYAKGIKDTSDTTWTSYGLQIAAKGDTITPLNLLTVTEGTEVFKPVEGTISATQKDPASTKKDPTDWTPKSIILYILCIYRLLKTSNEEYRDALLLRMRDQLESEGGTGMSFHGATGVYGSWLNDRNYIKLVAAYDMFLYKFKIHEDAILRMGSLGSRFRDCAGLLSLGYAMNILNVDAGSLMDWIFINEMGNEMLRMSRDGQESGDQYSYFPYQADLGLVSRSAYSSNANPYTFHWIQVIGALIGHKRSINARFNFEGSFSDLGLNAIVVVWAFARGGELDPQFAPDGRRYAEEIEIITQSGPAGGRPLSAEDHLWSSTTGRNPSTWFALLKQAGFKVPPLVSSTIQRQREKIKDPREGSVGEHVRDHLVY